MATSIDDLLDTVNDVTTGDDSTRDARDAASALDWCGRLLTHLRSDGIGADSAPTRDDVVRRLADACTVASATFECTPGRTSDLIAVTSDAVRCLRHDLSDSDRWAVAIRLATPARRLAAVIAASGPYAEVPQLLGVGDRSRELLHAAAASPPNLAELRGHDVPIPTTLSHPEISPVAGVVAATANLAAEFRLRGRDPMTARELLAVCHVASRVAEYVEAHRGGNVLTDQSQNASPSDAWRTARDVIALYTDGARLAQASSGGGAVLDNAMRIDAAVRRAAEATVDHTTEPNPGEATRLVERTNDARLMRYLQQLGEASEAEFVRIRPALFVQHGPRPLHESRVGEWLRKQTFAAQPPDLAPAANALRAAAQASAELGDTQRTAATHKTIGISTDWLAHAMLLRISL